MTKKKQLSYESWKLLVEIFLSADIIDELNLDEQHINVQVGRVLEHLSDIDKQLKSKGVQLSEEEMEYG